MTSLTLEPLVVPLRQDETGAIRVGNTRVLLELVIQAFEDGATPETIVQRYETLNLADVYAVISYYLTHRQEIDAYLQDCEQAATEIQRRIEAGQPERPGLRAEFSRRLAQKMAGNVVPGQ